MANQYSTKTEAELRFIIKDAAEAAEAMRGVSEQAEAKYLDQVNDASTELYRRRQAMKRANMERNIAMCLQCS